MAAPVIVTLRPGVAFAPEAAASWTRMERAAGRLIDVNSSYRDWRAQYQLWWNYTHQMPGAPFALHPDDSMHCKGLAVDTDDQALLRALVQHGWRQTALGINEPWHFDYFATLDKRAGELAGSGSVPLPIPSPPTYPTLEDIMASQTAVVACKNTKGTYDGAIVDIDNRLFSNWGDAPLDYAQGIAAAFGNGKVAVVTPGHFDKIRSDIAALPKLTS